MRKLFKVIPLTITLTILIMALLINITSKQVTEEITGEIWKAIIPESLQKTGKEGSNWFQDIMNNEEVKGFIDQYINTDKVKKTIEDMKETATKEVEKAFNEWMEEQEKKLSPGQRFSLNTFRFLTNAKLKGILIIAIIVNIILIAFTMWSFYEWIKPTSWAMALSGVAMLCLAEWLKSTIASLIKITTVTLNCWVYPAIILLVGGIIVRFIYFVIAKIISINHKGVKKDEIS